MHLGAPTPHLEHACRPPSFDDQVPFLKSALIPLQSGEKETSEVRIITR